MCPIEMGKVLQIQIGTDRTPEYKKDELSLSGVVLYNPEG